MLLSRLPMSRGSLTGGRRTRYAYGNCMAVWPLAPTQPEFTLIRSSISPPDGPGLRPNAKFCYPRPWIQWPRAVDTPEQSDSHLALEDVRRDRSLPISPPTASSGWSSVSKAPRNPPPPIRPGSPVVHPKSSRHARPSRSSRKSSRDGDWKMAHDGQ